MQTHDPSADVRTSREIARLTSALSLEEKAALTVGIDTWRTASFPRLGIPSVKTTDGPNGARGDTLDHSSVTPSVCIPSGTALGATWDTTVVEQASAVVARQAIEKGCRVLLAPTVNLHRHPLWGRNFECFSEDPVLTGKLASAYIEGVQNNDVVATIKHFVGNEVEHERNTCSSEIDERALRELYLLPFEYGVRNAHVLALMTSYNRVNGHYVPNDARLLDGILREEWGFAGFVMTDWSGIADTVEAVNAGLDLEMPAPARAYGAALVGAVRSGQLDEAQLDKIVHRILTVFDRVGALDEVPVEEHPEDREQDRAFVRRAASDGIVLLANDGLLPLETTGVGRLAIIGPNAERLAIMGGGSARVLPHYVLSPVTVLRERLGDAVEITYAPGVASDGVANEASIEAAVKSAEGADAVIIIVGTDDLWESEGYDRETLELPRNQDELVRRLLLAHPRSVVIVNSGSPVSLDWVESAAAVIQTWFGGQELANAIVDVLLGDSEPGGRLPTTLPMCLEHTPAFGNFPGESSKVRYGESLLVGYRWYETRRLPVRFPFGHGLSYTSFEIGAPSLSAPKLEPGCNLSIEVPVTNIGGRRGAEVVQLYVAPPEGGRSRPGGRFRPVKELRAFAKVWLDPGETMIVSLELNERSFAYYDVVDTDWLTLVDRMPKTVFHHGPVPASLHRSQPGWYVDSGTYELHIGRSSADISHVVNVEATGGDSPLPSSLRPL
ncbi:MAG: glycoside hydrolase family 3 C-terminal domain-containing protein [Acidimicrobiales bacterium]|jgi:beta-glucosidase